MLKNCILMMMRWKDLQKFIKNGCNRDPKLFTLKKAFLVYERIIYDRSDEYSVSAETWNVRVVMIY